ncbi:GMC oxidoreductase [Microdochium trichocladiopsis]|uniref:GMC oxidoreductase n=1 Tax=Microdochium trichocladiopsis TaxID=1682393 RepID=A0A9P8XTY1_9PEZI|nr:GMC oxidoreductase [Microdochium trichocladiopsis]KAH7014284.1 GMC oxidoreductase [Microdochium trichocladiopsis]
MKVTSTLLLATGAAAAWTSKKVQDQNIYPPNGYTHPVQAPQPGSTYEYIIVGSGAGGSPLAARLALAGHSVLLIDAGEDHGTDRQVQVPAMHPFASEYNPIRWDYFVERHDDEQQALRDTKYTWQTPAGDYWQRLNDTSAQPPAGSTKKGLLYPRTGALGGCTVHNALLMVQATKKDWDDIAATTGDASWSASNMRQYFKKLERNAYLQGGLLNSGSHGFSGWLPTRLTPSALIVQDLKITSLLITAATTTGKGLLGSLLGTVAGALQALTLDVNTDASNRDTADLIYQMPLAMNEDYMRTGPRDFVLSVATATNSDGSRKYKLDIVLNTLVTKVNFDQSGAVPKATGVDYIFGKSLYRADPRPASNGPSASGTVYASREVIVSGGAFNTPQILKLSGVGPAAELAAHGIPLVKNLPGVGGNLQDRYEIPIVGEAPTKFSLLADCTFLAAAGDPCYDRWKAGKLAELKGSYTTNGIAWGYLKHSSTSGPDHDLWIGGSTAYFHGYFPGYSRYATAGGNNWSWLTLKAHSRNRAGSVNLTSADPRDTPYINFRNFAEGGEEDLQALVEGMQYSLSAFDKLVPLDGSFKRVWPDPKTVNTPAELRQFAIDEAWGHHASCTAPIGADSDPMAVLDSKFRVRGVSGLRVVDASAFPRIPGLFIALPTYTMSEKAADVILADAAASP